MPSPTVLDEPTLWRLVDEVGGPQVLVGFVGAWLGRLEHRLSRLHTSLASGDLADLEDAVLSLQSSSSMLGARALEGGTSDLLQDSLRLAGCGLFPPTDAWRDQRLAVLRTVALETELRLRAFLDRLDRLGSGPQSPLPTP